MTYEELYRVAREVPVVETHEHQHSVDTRIKDNFGWTILLDGYARSALASAGMPESEINVLDQASDPKAAWRKVEPYFKKAEYSAYIKAVKIAAEMVYGVTEWDEAGVEALDEMVRKNNTADVNRRLFREIGNIDSYHVNALEGVPHVIVREGDDPELVEKDLSTEGFSTVTYRAIDEAKKMSEAFGEDGGSFGGFKRSIDKAFERHAAEAIAVKNQTAYTRKIDFAVQDEGAAMKFYDRFMTGTRLTDLEKKVITDWAYVYSVRKAAEAGLPVKMHTGYLAGTGTMATENTNPCNLEPMFRLFPKVKFDLFHIGYPFVDEIVGLVKHYPNVHLDMCWAWAVDWEAAKRCLKQAITAVPHVKIFAVGGDTTNAENAIGHVEMARRGVAAALSELVEEKYLSGNEATALVGRLLRENQLEVFGRKLTRGNKLSGWKGRNAER